MKYGRLTIQSTYMKQGKNRKYRFAHCLCECGNTTDVELKSLKRGETLSCGCLRREMRRANQTHGLSQHRLYHIWSTMKQRCYDINSQNYYLYGGRGIFVCEEWLKDFTQFFEWANSAGYSDDLTIDRIDSNGPYSPLNCRWSTQAEQNRNQRSNQIITAFGETKVATDWIRDTRCKVRTITTIANRIKMGMSPEDAITKEPHS
jgi:hypothetical protein